MSGKMKTNGCAVFIENKSGNFYQVALTKDEEDMVLNLIGQMHDGPVKVTKKIQPLKRNKK